MPMITPRQFNVYQDTNENAGIWMGLFEHENQSASTTTEIEYGLARFDACLHNQLSKGSYNGVSHLKLRAGI